MSSEDDHTRRARGIALVIAGVGLLWLTFRVLESTLGWSTRTGALVDLAALGGFAYALWLLFGLWRSRRNNKD
jgi:hypothetical protein